MQITKELLTARLTEARAQRDQFISEANMAIGAVKTLEHLLEVIELPTPPPAPTPPAPSKS
jgi:hypothetical protein